ncbi:MAG: MXAN_5187 C-terminal domain-containing protein, partial [Polyangiaceae bacterium]
VDAPAVVPSAAMAPRRPPPLPPKIKPAAGVPAVALPAAPAAPPAGAKPLAPPMGVKPAAPPAPKPPLPKPADKPAAPVAQAAPKPATAAAPAKPANPADLPENRVRQIYTQYVETKRKQNESTTAITYEGVAKSLRESTARLKEKHGGNSVDFEVTVKDGKTILRPVLKKEPK